MIDCRPMTAWTDNLYPILCSQSQFLIFLGLSTEAKTNYYYFILLCYWYYHYYTMQWTTDLIKFNKLWRHDYWTVLGEKEHVQYNQRTFLKCPLTTDHVMWTHTSIHNDSDKQIISVSQTVYGKNRQRRYRVPKRKGGGILGLLIVRVDFPDAGNFCCEAIDGQYEKSCTELIVDGRSNTSTTLLMGHR